MALKSALSRQFSEFIKICKNGHTHDQFIRPASPDLQAGDKGVANGIMIKVP